MTYPPGATSQSVDVTITDAAGAGVTGLVAGTFPTVHYHIWGANADVSLGALSDLALLTTAWVAKGVKEIGGGVYRLDLPDAVFASAGKVTVRTDDPTKILLLDPIEVGFPAVNTTHVAGTGQTAVDIGQQLDAAVSSRAQPGDTMDVGTWLGNLVTVDTLSFPVVTVGGFMSGISGDTFPPIITVGVNLDYLDAGVSSRATLGGIWTAGSRTLTSPTNFGSLAIDSNGRVKIQSGVVKNVAITGFEFFMADSADHVTGKTGLTVTATRSLDGAAFGACANAVAEVSGGLYKIDLAAADLNGGVITLRFTATGADVRIIEILTTP